MAGLLGNTSGGLMTGLLAPQSMRGATDEALRRQREQEAARIAAAAPAQPHRDRVSPWRVFDRVLGGETISGGLDAERARLQAESMRPQLEAQRAQILASIQDPRERALFLASPEDWAKNVGQQFAPQIVAPGSGQAIGGRLGVEMPSYTESGDQILRRTSQGIEPAFTRTAPSIAETIAQQNADSTRLTAERPIELAPGAVALNRDGSTFGRGADRILAAGDGVDLVSERGGALYSNPKDAPPVDPQAAAQQRAAAETARVSRLTMADNLQTGLTGARQFVGTAGVWNQMNPLNRQGRANLEAHLETIKGNITFEKLAAMKAASPTGASGLGALSDNESRMLASTVAALSPDMSPEQLQRSFGVIDRLVAKLRQDAAAPAQAGGVVAVTTPAEAQALPPGTRYRTPEGREYIR